MNRHSDMTVIRTCPSDGHGSSVGHVFQSVMDRQSDIDRHSDMVRY